MPLPLKKAVKPGPMSPAITAWIAKFYNAAHPREHAFPLSPFDIIDYDIFEYTDSYAGRQLTQIITGELAIRVRGGKPKSLHLNELLYANFTAFLNQQRYLPQGNPMATSDFRDYPEGVPSRFAHVVEKVGNVGLLDQRTGKKDTDAQNAVGFKCVCDSSWFCPSVLKHINTGITAKDWHSDLGTVGTWTQFLLPVFGNVLHRVEISKSLVPSWDGKPTAQFCVRSKVYPGIDDESYYPYPAKMTDKSKFLWGVVEEVEHSFAANADAISLMNSGISGVVQYSVRSCESTAHQIFGAHKKMLDFIGSDKPVSQDKLWSAVFTVLNYNVCYPCSRAIDTAFWINV